MQFCRSFPLALSLSFALPWSAARADEPPSPPTTTEPSTPAPSGDTGLGLSPQAPQVGGLVLPERAQLVAPPIIQTDEWRFEVHGFFRSPLRLGFGHSAGNPNGSSEWHLPSRTPDGEYTDWRYTNNIPGPWSQLNFLFGNRIVTGTVIIGAYNITDAGYRNLNAQLGINNAFLTFRFPNAVGGSSRVEWNVGAFMNRYGTAGKYDAGKYETYLFGRTHVVGETLSAERDFGDFTLQAEHGFGGKIATPRAFDTTVNPEVDALVVPTLLHHAHAGVTWKKQLTLAGHWLNWFGRDTDVTQGVAADARSPRVTVTGGEARLAHPLLGDGYLGYSHVDAVNSRFLSDAFEVLHSFAGRQLRNNYFVAGPPAGTVNPSQQEGISTGTIDTVLAQYTVSLGAIARWPQPFWGNGPDVTLTGFGMYNLVKYDDFQGAGVRVKKLKWGGEAVYTPLPWLGVAFRYDNVQPFVGHSEQAFQVFSPKLIFRTALFTHEQVVLQYVHYALGSGVTPAEPFQSAPADKDLVYLAAVMWW